MYLIFLLYMFSWHVLYPTGFMECMNNKYINKTISACFLTRVRHNFTFQFHLPFFILFITSRHWSWKKELHFRTHIIRSYQTIMSYSLLLQSSVSLVEKCLHVRYVTMGWYIFQSNPTYHEYSFNFVLPFLATLEFWLSLWKRHPIFPKQWARC